MRHMSRPEWREFALHGTRTGKLAVTRKGGAPHVTPVWFLLDSDAEHDYVLFTTESSSVKGRALRRDRRFALTVDDQAPPYSYVLPRRRRRCWTTPTTTTRCCTGRSASAPATWVRNAAPSTANATPSPASSWSAAR